MVGSSRSGGPCAALIGVAALVLALASDAQAAPPVVILVDGSVPQYKESAAAIKERLGGATVVELRHAEDPVAHARKTSPKVIIAVGQKALAALVGRISDTPVVYATVLYPEKHGLVGPNITGVPMEIPVGVQLARLKSVFPRVTRIGLIYGRDSGALVEEARGAARRHGVTIVAKGVASSRDVGSAVEEIAERVDALWLLPDTKIINKDVFAYLLRTTLDQGIPLFGFLEGLTEAGALASIGPDYRDIGVRAAELAIQILEHPAKLPSKTFSNGSLSVNLKTAQRLGMEPAKAALKLVNKVFK
ncbi:MAG: ABC transporter substrate-binding protein [Deltaproteobacteria bacterium]|nr:ABC transporter substrate-binding protein [Deltaproteobacteria bacterium]